tara:strand:+ start:971 stop:1309 length:339 start_codon:yes stop_codon:yes gene_type:complete
MPKPKPDQIIRHEIALSRPMQEAFDQFVIAHSFNSFATPSVDLMKDVSGMAVFLSILAYVGYKADVILTGETTNAIIREFKQQMDAINDTPVGDTTFGEGLGDFLDKILSRD